MAEDFCTEVSKIEGMVQKYRRERDTLRERDRGTERETEGTSQHRRE